MNLTNLTFNQIASKPAHIIAQLAYLFGKKGRLLCKDCIVTFSFPNKWNEFVRITLTCTTKPTRINYDVPREVFEERNNEKELWHYRGKSIHGSLFSETIQKEAENEH